MILSSSRVDTHARTYDPIISSVIAVSRPAFCIHSICSGVFMIILDIIWFFAKIDLQYSKICIICKYWQIKLFNMNTINYVWAISEKDQNLTVFSLLDTTGKLVMDLISESSTFSEITSYTIDATPALIVWSTTDYDVDSFIAIIQRYIEFLQHNEEQNNSFRLTIIRKLDISDSFYEKVWSALEKYADKITVKWHNNLMILNCD